jgi:hypothetical protein
MFFPAEDTIAFAEGGVESMRIDSVGNVGIGKIPGTSILDIAGEGQTGSNNMYLTWSTTSSGYGSTLNLRKSNGSKASPTAVVNGDQTGVLVFAGYDGSNYQNAAYIESRIDSTPGTNDMPGRMAFFTSADGSASPTERMRITCEGNVLVGTTGINPGYGNTSTGQQLGANGVSCFSRAFADWVITVNQNTADGSARYLMQFRVSNVSVGNIQSNGSNCTFNSTSDYRLKENVAPLTGALDRVSQLKPVTYKWKLDGSAGEGFIAHELQAVVPEAVTGEKDAMRTEQYEISPAIPAAYDEEGNELTPAVKAVIGEHEVPAYQGIDTSFLVATLTAAIQELKATVDAQAARIAALESAGA